MIPGDRTRAIIAEVADRHGIPAALLYGSRRDRLVAHVRQEAMWEVRRQTTLSFPQIGQRFNRDHTTVIHAVRAHEGRISRAPREAVQDSAP